MGAKGIRVNRVTFNELLHARDLAKDLDVAGKALDQMKSASVAVYAVTATWTRRKRAFIDTVTYTTGLKGLPWPGVPRMFSALTRR